MNLTPGESNRDELYRLVTSIIIPRPIGWVSTLSPTGESNLAPYSFYQGILENDPPIVMFSAEDAEDGGLKDSPENVERTGEFVLNLVTEDLVEQMDRTSESVPSDVCEFDLAGLEKVDSVTVDPYRVAAARAHLECTHYDTLQVGNHSVVFGEITHIHVDDSLLTDGKIDVEKIDAVGRLTGSFYAKLERFTVE